MVVQRTLTPPVGVRSSHPQPLRSRSTLLRFFITGCSAVGSALGSGPRGRGFESRHSDQKAVCTVSRYKRLFCLGVPRIRTARPRCSGAQISPVGCLRGRGRIPSPDRRSPVPYPGTNGFFVLECRGFEQPVPAAAGRKSARWAVCEGAGESLNIHLYRLALGRCPSRRIPAGLLLEESPFSGSNVGMGLSPR